MEQLACRPKSKPIDLQSLGSFLVSSSAIALAVIRRGRIAFANLAFHSEFRVTGSLVNIPLSELVLDVQVSGLEDALAAAEHGHVTYFGVDGAGLGASFEVKLELESAVIGEERLVIAIATHVAAHHHPDERHPFLTYTDALTRLGNRAFFLDRLEQALISARRNDGILAVLAVDLDGFKSINDNHGHDAGDAGLQQVVERFQRCIREGDSLARMGGDEFAVLLPRLADKNPAALVAQRMIQALRHPFELGEHQLNIGVSIGVAVYPQHAQSGKALLAAADTALFIAKRAGRNQFQWAMDPSEAILVPAPVRKSEYALAVKTLDDRHRHLAQTIEKLFAALQARNDPDSMVVAVGHLVADMNKEFAMEEGLMADYGLESFAAHRAAHRHILEDIQNLGITTDLTGIGLLLRYLREWLLRHTKRFDEPLGQALRSRGCR